MPTTDRYALVLYGPAGEEGGTEYYDTLDAARFALIHKQAFRKHVWRIVDQDNPERDTHVDD